MTYMDGIQLFGSDSNRLADALSERTQVVVRNLRARSAEDLLNTPPEVVVEQLTELGSAQCPQLLSDQVWLKPAVEVTKDFVEFGERRRRTVTRLVLVVPFEGNKDVFTLRADTKSTNPPRALRIEAHEIHLAIDDPPDDPAAVRARFDDEIANIEKYLGWSRTQIEAHNKYIRDELPETVELRRAELLKTQKLQSDTGYPTSRPSPGNT